jgi:hypothetical protein
MEMRLKIPAGTTLFEAVAGGMPRKRVAFTVNPAEVVLVPTIFSGSKTTSRTMMLETK